MSLDATSILLSVVVGIGATVIMDAWATLMKLFFSMTSLNYCLVGRWLLHLRHGTFIHNTIINTEAQSMECALGWLAHYVTGVVFALLLTLITAGQWLQGPDPVSALLLGIATVAFPFFILQPCLGFGIAGSLTPKPVVTRLKSLMAHASFGVGLYLSALLVGMLLA